MRSQTRIRSYTHPREDLACWQIPVTSNLSFHDLLISDVVRALPRQFGPGLGCQQQRQAPEFLYSNDAKAVESCLDHRHPKH